MGASHSVISETVPDLEEPLPDPDPEEPLPDPDPEPDDYVYEQEEMYWFWQFL